MKIRAINEYIDTQLKKLVKVGDEYEVSEERGKQIVNAKFAEEVKEAEEVKVPFDSIVETVTYEAEEELEKEIAKPKKVKKTK